MPIYSFVDYTGDGVDRDFTITFPYISKSHVIVTVNAVVQTAGVDFNYTSGSTINFPVAPANGLPIRIRRVTPATGALVDFSDAVTLHDTDLDTTALQTVYLVQENRDEISENMITDPADGKWDGQSKVIKDIDDGVADTDAATVGQIAPFAVAAAASAADAETAKNLADYYMGQANAAYGAADAAASAALAYSQAAQSSEEDAEAAALSIVPCPIGAMIPWPAPSAPDANWMLAQGQSLLRSTYAVLFYRYGTTWGSVDGTHFNLPDMRSRKPIGAGQGSGLTNRVLGTVGGEETHALTEPEMPSHTHTIPTRTTGPGSSTTEVAGAATSGGSSGTVPTNATGSGNAHNVMDPWLATNFIIRVL